MWFRRDLRLSDNPALVEAGRDGGEVVPLFVLDDGLWAPAGDARRAFLVGCLRALDEAVDGRLVVRRGRPEDVVPDLAREVGAVRVFVAEDFGPYGRARDDRVAHALPDGRRGPDTRRFAVCGAAGGGPQPGGQPVQGLHAVRRAWLEHGWPGPAAAPRERRWVSGLSGDGIPEAPAVDRVLPEPGEAAAKRAARRFWERGLPDYADRRDVPARMGRRGCRRT